MRSAAIVALLGLLGSVGATQRLVPRADYHVHLSLESAGALDSLIAHGITAVRDCGGNMDSLLKWRDEIASGKRRGPRLYVAGPLIDGPKAGAEFRLNVTDAASAEHAVDSLAGRRVDFLKVHNAVAAPAFYALLRRARARHLRVAVHLPRDIPAWTAVDSGAGSIEHAAESLLSSPLYAGFAQTPAEAVTWWKSSAGDSVIRRWGRLHVVVVPTLVRYEAMIGSAADASARAQRAALMPDLIDLVRRMNAAGVRIRAGTDVSGVPNLPTTWAALDRELVLLAQAGLSASQLLAAASPDSLSAWIEGK